MEKSTSIGVQKKLTPQIAPFRAISSQRLTNFSKIRKSARKSAGIRLTPGAGREEGNPQDGKNCPWRNGPPGMIMSG